MFQHAKITKSSLEQILFMRISKWGKASGVMNFGFDPLWQVNPQGAIAVHQHSLNKNFWQMKGITFDIICATDGAWGINYQGNGLGGIGGWFSDSKGSIIHKFSGPYFVNSSIESELGAIINVAEKLSKKRWANKRILICTDSMEALDLIKLRSYLCLQLLKEGANLSDLFNSNVTLNYVPRDLNEEADSLAKSGLSRPSLVNYWANGWHEQLFRNS